MLYKFLFFRMIDRRIKNFDLTHTNNDDMAFYHVTFQAKYPNYTYMRECITVRPPSSIELLDEHRASI